MSEAFHTPRTLLFLLLNIFILAASAQTQITGKVVESDSGEPVAQTTVRLIRPDSTLAAGVLTNLEGGFTMKAPAAGSYIVQITCVGFKTYTNNIKVADGKDLALGTIKLSPDAIMLKGATVTGQAAKVVVREDTFIYNAAAYRTPEGSVVEELVRKLPGAQVSDDGTITINGKTVKKIMVDGKEFMTGDTRTAMQNLPTSIVERVKAYDQRSDLSRVSGIDDGEEETVLDFGIKKGMNKGLMVNADVAIGTQDRYSSRIFGGWMKDNFKIFLMGNGNNVNDRGFPGGGGGRGGGGRQGLTATKMTGANFNYEEKGKLKWDGSVRWNHSDGDAMVRRSTESFMSSTASTFGNSLNSNLSRSNSWNGQMRIEWMPDSVWNINFRPTFRYNSSDGMSYGNSVTFDSDPYAFPGITNPLDATQLAQLKADSIVRNANGSNSLSYSDSKSVGASLQINRRLSSTGRNVTLRFTGNYSEGISRSMSNSMVDYFKLKYDPVLNRYVDSTYQANRYAATPTKNWDYSVRATYSEPIMPRTYLQFSYQFQYKYSKSDRSTYDLTRTGRNFFGVAQEYRGWDNYLSLLDTPPAWPLDSLRDSNLSRFSQYKNYIHTAELMLRVVRNSYNLNVGVQVIPQSSELSYRYMQTDTVFKRHVSNWSPTADFRWKISKVSQLRFNYRGTTSQPSMTDLLDIEDNSNPLNISKGNPGLKPSFTQNFRLFYNNYIQNHQRSVMANISFATTSNSVSNMVTYVQETGGRITQPQNINGNWNAQGMFMFNTAIDSTGYFNVNTYTTLRYTNSVGYVSQNRSSSSEKSTTRTTNIGERLAGSFRNDWIEVELNGSLDYQHARSELQTNNNLDTWTFSYGGSVQLQMPWNMQLSTNLNMNSRRGYSDATMNTNELIWNAQLSQSFLKGNALTLSLQLYDILHEQSTFSRAISAMQRTDTEYNAITSYAMLHAIYRLNVFGGKAGRESMRGGRGEGRGERGEGGGRGGFGGGGRGGFGGGGGGRGGRF